MSEQKTLYERIGGYEAIYKFAEDVIARLMDDEEVGHIWDHMSQDRVFKEHQNFVDWLCEHWGGPAMYRGRDLLTVHRGWASPKDIGMYYSRKSTRLMRSLGLPRN